jgi:hypothetical protein
MYRNLSISLVLPARNEAEGLRHLLSLVPDWLDEILVVDSSTDDSPEVAQAMGARVISSMAHGYGRALKTGFKASSGEIIVAMDADGSYPVESSVLETLVDRLIDDDLHFLSTSRFPMPFDPLVMPWSRFLGNRLVTAWANILFQQHIQDVLSGMWVFRNTLLPRLTSLSNDWNFSQEIKLACFTDPTLRCAEHRIPYGRRIGTSTLDQHPLDLARVGLGNLRRLWNWRWKGGLRRRA